MVIGLALLAMAVATVVGLSLSGDEQAARPPSSSAASANQPANGLRTLVVFPSGSKPSPSRPGPVMRAWRVRGKLPARQSVATVLTDEECAADSAGISRCLNKLRLKGGSLLVVRHPHDMHQVPCMSPGEPVRVRAA